MSKQDTFTSVISLLNVYVGYHIVPRHVIDFIDKERIGEILPYLEKVRIYSEPVYEKVIDFFSRWGSAVGAQERYDSRAVLCLTGDEVEKYYSGYGLPPKDELTQRYPLSALYFYKDQWQFLGSERIAEIEEVLKGDVTISKIFGSCAYAGRARGVARVVHDPSLVTEFRQGDILVAPMTRPEYLPFMKKASAIVTDAGRLLSHAAIVARELRVPCVVGTKNATAIIKENDIIEVDAEKGLVTKR